MGLFGRSNDALDVNPTVGADIGITTHGSDWYWAVTAVMALSTFIFLGMSFRVPRRNRVFHYITASITLVASIAYFSMASNLGYTGILAEFTGHLDGTFREIFYVRYIDWVITTPLLLLDLLLTAGLPWPTILFTLLLDEVMIVVGLVGALVSSSYKWGYFTFGMIALFGVAWNVIWVARKHAFVLGTEVHRTFMLCGVWTMFLWFLYPIAWGLSEGGNVIHPDSEAAFYGVLDILAKPIFGFLLLWGHRNIDPAALGLHIRDYDDGVGTTHHEKRVAGTGATNTTGVTGTPATAV